MGTKVAIAQALDKHDTIGQDLVGMVVDDIVVVGAKPLFMTDYIACGKVVPERIADIVAGIARACAETGTALVGGETAEHPGLLGPDDYDVAGAAVGAVEADAVLGPERVQHGDVVVAIASSGLHSNGFSLVRHILAERDSATPTPRTTSAASIGEVLLEPTRLYTTPLLRLIDDLPGRRARPQPRDRRRASPPTWRACCRRAPGSSWIARPGARSRCSACSPTGAASRSPRPRAPGTSASA